MESWREELYASDRSKFLAHHGIKGQKWGIRRYQNEDGSLTPEGRERYGGENGDELRRRDEALGRIEKYEKENRGKHIGKAILIGRSNERTYDMARQFEGDSRFKAYLKSVFDLDYTDVIHFGVSVAGEEIARKLYNDGSLDKDVASAVAETSSMLGMLAGSAAADYAYSKGKVTSIRQKKMLDRASGKGK